MKIAIILGTRPEIIKLAPVIKGAHKRGLEYYVLHTGQHYDFLLDEKIFVDLEIPKPNYNLGLGGTPYRMQIGNMIKEIIDALTKDLPDVVIVQGDTNSVLAGALAANKLGITLVHLEAGLRCHDLDMFEETNRIMTDHISDLLFAPTEEAVNYLKEEGIPESRIYLTGNTVVDSLLENIELSKKKSKIIDELGLSRSGYILVTAHRAENVDIESRFRDILTGLNLVAEKTGLPIIYSMHPRAKKRLEEFGILVPKTIRIIGSLGYLDFIELESNAKIIITDSGGLQEEACILKIPCVTIRDNTERPETIKLGVNILAGTKPEDLLRCAIEMLGKNLKDAPSPYGDGDAAKKTLDIISTLSSKRVKMKKELIKDFYSNYSDKIIDKRFKSQYKLRSYAHKKQYESVLSHVTQGMKVLDAGCGEGVLSVMMSKKGALVTGTDISVPNIEAAKQFAKSEGCDNINFFVSDLDKLPFADNEFDLVVSSHVLEHLPNFDRGLSEVIRVTKKRAVVAIPTVFNLCSLVQVGGGMFWLKGPRSFLALPIGFLKMLLALVFLREGVDEKYEGTDLPHVFRFPWVMKRKIRRQGSLLVEKEASSLCLPYFETLLPIGYFLDKFKKKPFLRNLGYGTTYIIEKRVN